MDQRQTFANYQELYTILDNLYIHKQSVSLLVDAEGLSRMEGLITTMEQKETIDQSLLAIDGSALLKISQVIAVNGIFHSNYSEC